MSERKPVALPPSKLPHVGTTIFSVMSRLAAEQGALNLSQGFPDFDGPPALLDRVAWHLNHGHNQYAPMTGVPELRQAIADSVQACHGRVVDPETEVTVTSGATEALFCAIHALIRAGDEVIVFDPAYDSYQPAVELAGGHCIHVPLQAPEFRPDWQQVRDAIGPRTRLLIVNTPHNPTGSVWSEDDLRELEMLTVEQGLWVLSDEVYEHIVFDGRQHHSIHRSPALAERAFVVSSFGKTFHVTGWKLGYCVAPPALSSEFRKVHQYVTFASITPVQHALADFMTACPEHARELGSFYQGKRDRFCAGLEGSRLRWTPAAGTYFQLVEYSAVSAAADTDFARQLVEAPGIAAVPVSVFQEQPLEGRWLRFCFAKDDATLDRATALLRSL